MDIIFINGVPIQINNCYKDKCHDSIEDVDFEEIESSNTISKNSNNSEYEIIDNDEL